MSVKQFTYEERVTVVLVFVLIFLFSLRAVVQYITLFCGLRGFTETQKVKDSETVGVQRTAFSAFQRCYCALVAFITGAQAFKVASIAAINLSLTQYLPKAIKYASLSGDEFFCPILEFFVLGLTCLILAPLSDCFSLKVTAIVCLLLQSIDYLLLTISASRFALFFAELCFSVTSFLFYNVCDSWMVQEHQYRGFRESWFLNTYMLLILTLCPSVFICGNVSAQLYNLKNYATLFLTGLCSSVLITVLCSALWSETLNYKFKPAWKRLLPQYRKLNAYSVALTASRTLVDACSTLLHFEVLTISTAQHVMLWTLHLAVKAWREGDGLSKTLKPNTLLLNAMLAFCIGSVAASMISASQEAQFCQTLHMSNCSVDHTHQPTCPPVTQPGGWNSAVEIFVDSTDAQIFPSHTDVLERQMNNVNGDWDRYKIPLVAAFAMFQTFILVTFGILTRIPPPTSARWTDVGLSLWVSFCFGGQFTLGATIQAQRLPLQSRVTVLSLSSLLARGVVISTLSLLAYCVIKRPLFQKNTFHDSALLLTFLSGISLSLTLFSAVMQGYRKPTLMQYSSSCVVTTPRKPHPPFQTFTPLCLFFKNQQSYDTPPQITPCSSANLVYTNEDDVSQLDKNAFSHQTNSFKI